MASIKNESDHIKTVIDFLSQHKRMKGSKISELKSRILETPIGLMFAVANDTHLLLLLYLNTKRFYDDIERLMQATSSYIDEGKNKHLDSIQRELNMYFKGELKEFETPIFIQPSETEFHSNVWKEMYKIPYGKTCSYSELAKAIGKPLSFRAVANACGRNPFAIIIPCHRVVKSDGSLGGYTSGNERKVWLFKLEQESMKK